MFGSECNAFIILLVHGQCARVLLLMCLKCRYVSFLVLMQSWRRKDIFLYILYVLVFPFSFPLSVVSLCFIVLSLFFYTKAKSVQILCRWLFCCSLAAARPTACVVQAHGKTVWCCLGWVLKLRLKAGLASIQ